MARSGYWNGNYFWARQNVGFQRFLKVFIFFPDEMWPFCANLTEIRNSSRLENSISVSVSAGVSESGQCLNLYIGEMICLMQWASFDLTVGLDREKMRNI